MTDVRGIYKDTFNLFLEYEKNKSIKEFNLGMKEISKKYNYCSLCQNILISLAGHIQGEVDKERE